MSENKNILTCVNCDSELKNNIEEWLYQCDDCGLYKSLLFDEKFNGLKPIGWTDSASDFLEDLREANAKIILNELSREMPLDGKSLLDIGCAAGWFLEIAKQHKMIATGLEPENNIATKGINKGLDIKTVAFPDASLGNRKFDVITFNDVFEHIEQPDEILGHVHEQLSDNGYLIINLPSSNGVIYRISSLLAGLRYLPPLERLWQKGYFSPHLYYYANDNLAALVEKHGFKFISRSRLDTIRIDGLWSRINHDGKMNIVVSGLIYISLVSVYPLLKYVLPSDIMFHTYKKV